MTTRAYSFYPGCSSQQGASSSNYLDSTLSMCEALGITLNEIPDWNCCSASVGYGSGGELPRLTLSARNIALSERHNANQEIVATCAACWLSTREASERLAQNERLAEGAREALAEGGLELANQTPIRHMVEVLMEDVGLEQIKGGVTRPLTGLKVAGYVGCQTNRPFGIAGESYEDPRYLDHMIESTGAESIPTFEKKVQCCGGALAFSEPEKAQEMIKGILESAHDHQADLIATPCPLCQTNVEIYQSEINARYNTQFNMPVVYYSQLISVAYGHSAEQAALGGQLVPATPLETIANR